MTNIGQSVKVGDEVMNIVPDNAPLEIRAYVLNSDIGFVAANGDGALGANRAADVARIGSAAADCFARAIARGAWEAARQDAGRGGPSRP